MKLSHIHARLYGADTVIVGRRSQKLGALRLSGGTAAGSSAAAFSPVIAGKRRFKSGKALGEHSVENRIGDCRGIGGQIIGVNKPVDVGAYRFCRQVADNGTGGLGLVFFANLILIVALFFNLRAFFR
ncbi:MAG: hypothetical protein UV99_C0002G0029 [Parcubacteria group bacterium GW2011_GWC1_43_61]|nr:MAG: hypothetical protein UV99_C0002G0029 [Parcubacteria group bacterium GW2011_GWC1_43_61]